MDQAVARDRHLYAFGEHVDALPVFEERRLAAVLRRMLDIVVASLALCIALPILAIVALAVRLDSPGPAMFRQRRVGQGGKLFTLYKFRGMYVDAPHRWPELYDYRYGAQELQQLRFHAK